MRYEIKESGFGDTLGQAVTLFKNHFGPLMGISFCLMIPFMLVTSLAVPVLMPEFAAVVQPLPETATFEQEQERLEAMWEVVPVFMAFGAVMVLLWVGIVIPVTNGVTTYALSQAYLGGKPSVGGAIRFTLERLSSLLWTALLGMILIFLGLLLLIFPGVVLYFRYFLLGQVVMIEGKSGMAALKRSAQLMKGHETRVFALGILLSAGNIPAGIVVGLIPVPEVSRVVYAVLLGVLGALGASAWTVLYFSARCKHEGFDLARLAESLSQGAPCSGPGNGASCSGPGNGASAK